MTHASTHGASSRRTLLSAGLLVGAVLAAGATGVTAATAAPTASPAPVKLGTAGYYAVLAASTATNAGASVLRGGLGVSPGTAAPGFGPGTVLGVKHLGDAPAATAQADLHAAYANAAGRTATTNLTGQDLGGKTLRAGVYKFNTSAALGGTLTLDARGNPKAVFIVQTGSTLTTGISSQVRLIGGAKACNVFWQVGSSATLNDGSTLAGTVMAKASITVRPHVSVQGRLMAVTSAVTLNTDTVTRATC